MRTLYRIWLALRITFLEARIQLRRHEIAKKAEQLDEDRRRVNLAHQAFAALDGRHTASIHQLRHP